jgi:hypothetical protein
MISSPGCVCLTNGASGPMTTRDWTTSRLGDAEILPLQALPRRRSGRPRLPRKCWSRTSGTLATGVAVGVADAVRGTDRPFGSSEYPLATAARPALSSGWTSTAPANATLLISAGTR